MTYDEGMLKITLHQVMTALREFWKGYLLSPTSC